MRTLTVRLMEMMQWLSGGVSRASTPFGRIGEPQAIPVESANAHRAQQGSHCQSRARHYR